MNGNCHFVYGASVGIALAMNMSTISTVCPNIVASKETATLFVLGGLLGGIFPDIDNPSSHMGKLAVPVSTGIGVINKHLGKTGANHRGILHDPVLYLTLLFLSYQMIPSMVGFFIGCLSHVFLDMFNPKGVPVLFKSRLRLGNITSGDQLSIVFTWILALLALAIGYVVKYYC